MYTSTRQKRHVGASAAIINGLAPDGGLYTFKRLQNDFFRLSFADDAYPELARKVFTLLLDDFPEEAVRDIVRQAYHAGNFNPAPAALSSFGRCSFLELFNGKTLAFKDIALAALPYMFYYAKQIQGVRDKTILLTATSGDTGGAALSGFRNVPGMFLFVLYPKYGVSLFQEKQMHHLAADNCFLVPVDANFDECQRLVKMLIPKIDVPGVIVSSANSINIGRLIPQIVYYIYGYCELIRKGVVKAGERVNAAVPTGNFGNIYAAYCAKRLGVPLGKLIVASNANNVLTQLFRTNTYETRRTFYKTISPSMDIIVSGNFERYLYDIIEDEERVATLMGNLQSAGHVYIKELAGNDVFYPAYADDQATKAAISDIYRTYGYVTDPHTAVAYDAYRQYCDKSGDVAHTLIVATASPVKFPEAVASALRGKTAGNIREDIHYLTSLCPSLYNKGVEEVLNTAIGDTVYSGAEAAQYILKAAGDIHVTH